jgi:hypothetical protein
VSLRSSGVRDAIERYWERSEGGLRTPYQVRFIARSGAAAERRSPVSNGEPGLLVWQR